MGVFRVAKVIVGGYERDVTLLFEGTLARAARDAVLPWLAQGKGLFLDYKADDPFRVSGTVWVGQSSSIRFEFDGDEYPLPAPEKTEKFEDQLLEYGGIVLKEEEEE